MTAFAAHHRWPSAGSVRSCLSQARLQGCVARAELGALRDPRFVLPALAHPDYEVRLVATACLAFLGHDPAVGGALRAAAESDPDVGVRQGALWAFGIAVAGPDAAEPTVPGGAALGASGDADYEAPVALLRDRATRDPSPRLREFAARGVDTVTRDDGRWWRM